MANGRTKTSLIGQFWDALKQKAIDNVAAAIITIGVLALATGASTAWAILKHWVIVQVPHDAVIAFNGPCPSGWEQFKPATARFVIGAGNLTDASFAKWKQELPTGGFQEQNLTIRSLNEAGGEENHILTVKQMPSHTHDFTAIQSGGSCAFSGCNGNAQSTTRATAATGGNQPHNLLPPFISLNYCIQAQ